MIRYSLVRFAVALPVMLIVAFIVFGLLHLAPGDPAAALAGDNAPPEAIEKLRSAMGLDRAFLVQFFDWLGAVAQGDLGHSLFDARPVAQLIADRAAPTLSLMLITIVLSVAVAIPLGCEAAWRMGSALDMALNALSTITFSVPVYVVGYVLILFFSLNLGWTPVQGYVDFAKSPLAWGQSLILPALALGSSYIALIALIVRTTVSEALGQDYIRAARAKGLSSWRLLYIHALKNAAIPVATVIGSGIAMLIGGAVVTESVFGIPGIGRLTIDAIAKRDIPVIQGIVLVSGLSYILINVCLDILYRLLDPRLEG